MAVSRINEAGLNVNQYGNRNIIYNGAMNVAQRSTSVTGIGASAGYFTCDRWKIEVGGTAGRLTQTQTADGPNGISANCLKLDCTTADTSIAASEYLILTQPIEGQDLQRIAKGTSGAKKVTLSFYVKANAAFTFVAEFQDNTNARLNGKTFATTTDWVRHELTFEADTTGAFNDNNAEGGRLNFWLHAGATYAGGTLPSGWVARSGNDVNRAAGISSFFSNTANNFFITGLQMEVGDTATDFEHRSFADELQKCQRYYQVLDSQFANGGYLRYCTAYMYGATSAEGSFHFPVEMRATPTLTASGTIAVFDGTNVLNASSVIIGGDGSSKQLVAITLGGIASGGVQYRPCSILSSNNTTSKIEFIAEL